MQRTYIEYKDKGYWITESFIELLSDYICKEFEEKEITDYSEGLQEVYDQCDGNRSGAALGMVGIAYHRHIKDTQDEQNMIAILQQTKTTLQAKGEKITEEELNEIESRKTDDYFKRNWQQPIYVSSFVATLDAMIGLLDGSFPHPKNHGLWYKGFGSPSGISEV
jgi:hypothetical protein